MVQSKVLHLIPKAFITKSHTAHLLSQVLQSKYWKKTAKELNILVLQTLSPRPPGSILTAVLLVCALGTFLSVLLSSLVQKAVKRQKKLASFLMALLRLLYVVYIYTPTHSFYQWILAWIFNTMVPEYMLSQSCVHVLISKHFLSLLFLVTICS